LRNRIERFFRYLKERMMVFHHKMDEMLIWTLSIATIDKTLWRALEIAGVTVYVRPWTL